MSNSRQTGSKVRSSALTHPPGQALLPTQPGWDYLIFATSGVFTAKTDTHAWLIPTHRALCVPDGTQVHLATTRRTAIRTLYFRTELGVLDADIRVVSATPLTRELLSHAVSLAPMNLSPAPHKALVTLLADQLANEPKDSLQLPLPTDPTANNVATSIMQDPAGDLAVKIRAANASQRTIERRFKSETRLSLGQWRRRSRIIAAVGLLAQGDNVTETAVAVGYSSPSAFVSAFKSELGAPPREFMRS